MEDESLKSLSKSELLEFFDGLEGVDDNFKAFINTVDTSGNILGQYSTHLETVAKSTSGLSKVTKMAGSVIKSLGASFASAAISMGVSFIASKAIEGISYAMNYSKNLADSAKGAGEAITQTDKDIDSYKNKITELQGVLTDHSSTVEEVTSAKQQLLDIQNELTEKYGSEASGIDLVNGSLERQLELLDGIKSSEYYKEKSDVDNKGFFDYILDGISKVKSLISGDENDSNWDVSKTDQIVRDYNRYEVKKLKASKNKELNQYIKDQGFDLVDATGDNDYFSFLGNTDDAIEKLDKINKKMQQLHETGKLSSEDMAAFQKSLDSEISDAKVYQSEHKDYTDATMLYDRLAKNSKLQGVYDNLTTERENYQKALVPGDEDALNQSLQNYKNYFDQISNLTNDASLQNWMKDLYSDMNEAMAKSNLKEDIQNNVSDVMDIVNAISDESMGKMESEMLDSSNIDALISKYEELGLTAQDVIDVLKDLGMVQTDEFKELEKQADVFDLNNYKDIVSQYQQIRKEMQQKGISENASTTYGNIDLSNRGVISWDKNTLQQYKKELQSIFTDQSWDSISKDMEGTISTVLGGSKEYDGIEIAFSPMLQTGDGKAELLSQDTVDKYIESLISDVKKEKDNWSTEDLLNLDAKGLTVDGKKINNIIADVGKTARKTGESMHYIGKDGALQNQIHALAQALNTTDKEAEKKLKMFDYLQGLSKDKLQFLYEIKNVGEYTPEELDKKIKTLQRMSEQKIDINDRTNLNNYNEAKENGSKLNDYNSYVAMKKETQELYEKGLVNDEQFKKGAIAFSENGMSDAANWVENMNTIGKYFTDDAVTGMNALLTDMSKLTDSQTNKKVADLDKTTGKWILRLGDLREIANQLHMPVEALNVSLKGLTAYGFTDDYFGSMEDGTQHATDKMQELIQAQTRLSQLQQKKNSGQYVSDTVIQEAQNAVDEAKQSLTTTAEGIQDLYTNTNKEIISDQAKAIEKENVFSTIQDAYKELNDKLEKGKKGEKGGISQDAYDQLKAAYDEGAKAFEEGYDVKLNFDDPSGVPQIESDLDAINMKVESSQQTWNGLMDQVKSGKLSMDDSEVTQAEQDLRSAIAEKQEFEKPAIMNIDTNSLNSEAASVVSTIQNIIQKENELEQEKALNIDNSKIEETQGEIDDMYASLENKGAIDIMCKLGLAKDGEIGSIDDLKKSLRSQTVTVPIELDKNYKDNTSDKTVTLYATVNGQDQINTLNQSIKDIASKTGTNVVVSAEVTGGSAETVSNLQTSLGKLTDQYSNVNCNINLNGAPAILIANGVALKLDAIDKTEARPSISVSDNASGKISSISSSLDSLNGKVANTYVYHHETTIKSTQNGDHANGTFHGYAKGTNVSLRHDENALVNEVGTEGLLRDGVLYEIPGSAHTMSLRKGDIIFNHKQLDELQKHGYITSNGGHGQLIGNGFAEGTLSGLPEIIHGFAGGMRGSLPSGSSSSKKKKSTSSSMRKSSSGSSSSSSSSNSSSSNSSSDSSDDYEEIKDWVEVYLSRQERITNNLIDAIDRQVGLLNKQTATNKAIAQVQKEITAQQKSANRYKQQADSVDLSESYKSQVRNGTLDIEMITDEDLKKKIDDYQEWYEKYLDCIDAVDELKDKLTDLAQTKFDNVTTEFENQISLIEHEKNLLNSSIDLIESKGYLVSQKLYNSLLDQESQNLEKLKSEYNTLVDTRDQLVKDGLIKKYSDEWYDMTSSINDVSEAILESKQSTVEFQNAIRQLKWDIFDKTQDMMGEIQTESDFLIDLMSNDKMYDTDTAKITDKGQATMGLHTVNYNAYMRQADEYYKELQNIQKQLANDPYNQDLKERYDELLEKQRDMIKSAEDEKQSIIDLTKDGYDAFMDVMDKIIEKRQKFMDQQKDLYDYEKDIADQTKEISQLQKQLDSYSGDTSEESQATIQQLKTSLADAQQNLQDSEYERYISDQNDLYDDLKDTAQEYFDAKIDQVNEVINQAIIATNTNAADIKNTLTTEAGNVGTTLSNAMNAIWSTDGTFTNVVTQYQTNFSGLLTTTNSVLNNILNYIANMVKDSDKKAETQVKENNSIKSTPSKTPTPAPTPKPATKPTTNNTSSKWGSWFIKKRDYYPKGKLNVNESIVD